jgi:hypothetical protein
MNFLQRIEEPSVSACKGGWKENHYIENALSVLWPSVQLTIAALGVIRSASSGAPIKLKDGHFLNILFRFLWQFEELVLINANELGKYSMFQRKVAIRLLGLGSR